MAKIDQQSRLERLIAACKIEREKSTIRKALIAGRLKKQFLQGSVPYKSEQWKSVPGFPDLQASSNGRIREIKVIDEIAFYHQKVFIVSKKYYGFSMKGKPLWVHILVGLAWVENPDNLPYINHKNGRKKDNRPVNLEWCTGRYNTLHAIYELGHIPTFGLRPTLVTKNGVLVFEGRSVQETARFLGCKSVQVSRVCGGSRNHYNGFSIKYADLC